MADKRDGDELFEDLDKFFAPIRDVDWDEDDVPAPQAAAEEHVQVHSAEASDEPDPLPEPTVVTFETDDGEASDEDWYGGATPAAEGGLGDLLDEDESDEEAPEPDESVTQVVIIDEDDPVAVSGQSGLFTGDADGRGEDPPDPGDAADETWAPAEPVAASPSDEDLEAAAAHFAGSLREEATYDTAPIDVMDEGSDLLADLGAPEDIEEDILGDLREPSGAPRTVVVGAEGTSGPSWQDVATVEVGGDLDRRGPGAGERDVPAAFMTGLVLAGVALGALWFGEAAFAVVAGLAVLIAQGELFGVMVRHHQQPATAIGLVAGVLMMAAAYSRGEAATPAMFALGVLATFLWFMTVPAAQRKDIVRNIGLTVLNMAWIPLLAGYLIATLKMEDGPALVVAVIGLTFVYDTAAFLVGSVWGGSFFQRALAPHISPKKSLEGLIGATLVTVVVSVALVPSFIGVFEEQRLDALLLAVVVALAATLGDLAESLVKRDLGIKDMGSILPGHGGVLDRIDSLLFVAPAAFLLFRVVL